nr:MAG TPA: hypothetical protein [Caudoviricetes sp.]
MPDFYRPIRYWLVSLLIFFNESHIFLLLLSII